MKNYLHFITVSIIATLVLASCSQGKDLTSSDKSDTSRRYYKEYIGNKIVYHDKETNAKEEKTRPDTQAEGNDNLGLTPPLTSLSPKTVAPKTGGETLREQKKWSEENEKSLATSDKKFNLIETFKKNHKNVVSGRVFTKKFHTERIAAENRAFGASEVFGLLALIFGAASVSSFMGAAIGITFGVVAIVFGILGQDAEGPWGVFSLVGFILGIVGAALSFIFIFA